VVLRRAHRVGPPLSYALARLRSSWCAHDCAVRDTWRAPASLIAPRAALNTYQRVRARAATSNLGRVLIAFLFAGAPRALAINV